MLNRNTLHYWLAIMLLPGIGPRSVVRWLRSFSSIEKLFSASRDEWIAAGIPEKCYSLLQKPDWRMVEKQIAWANHGDQHLICLCDEDYPPQLKEISDPPLVLYVHGDKSVLHQTQLAMVGARHATPAGLLDAEQFAFSLAEAGFGITSGLALGVDGASHRGALRAKGKTIAVMGTGINHIYPLKHKGLAREIVEQGGALISEFPLDTTPNATHFPRRNRIISGLSRGVLIVEAAIKSGSLITAKYAIDQNRDVFAIPGSIHNPLSRGCHYLIRQGAKLVETANDVLEELSIFTGQMELPGGKRKLENKSLEARNPSLSTSLRQLLDQIDYATTPFDVIVLRSGLTLGEVSSMLLSLTLEGYVQTVAGGYIRIPSVN